MNISLSDFSYQELQFLSIAMDEKLKDLHHKVEEIEKFPDGELKTELLEFWNKHIELTALWKTQAFNASVAAKITETIQSN